MIETALVLRSESGNRYQTDGNEFSVVGQELASQPRGVALADHHLGASLWLSHQLQGLGQTQETSTNWHVWLILQMLGNPVNQA
jgi:hypothetical protein